MDSNQGAQSNEPHRAADAKVRNVVCVVSNWSYTSFFALVAPHFGATNKPPPIGGGKRREQCYVITGSRGGFAKYTWHGCVVGFKKEPFGKS